MERMIIELIKDSGVRRDYKIFNGTAIHIGRGYNNDFIVLDPHVCEQHCIIRAGGEGFTIEDLTSTNGTWVNGRVSIHERSPLHSGDEITIGRTRLRFLASHHPVGPAIPLAVPSEFLQEINRPQKAWLVVASALFLALGFEHQESYKNMPVEKFISIGIGMLLVILVWAGVWAFVGRLIKHRSHFNAHLSWAGLFFLAMTLAYPLADHLGYMMSSPIVEMFTGSVIFWTLFSFLIAGHLTLTTFLSRRNQIMAALILSTVIIAFGLVTYYAGKSEFNSQPDVYSTIMPPYAGPVAGDSIDGFIQKSDPIFLPAKNAQ